MKSIDLPVIIQWLLEYGPVIAMLIIFLTFKSKILPSLSKLLFKASLISAIAQITQNPAEFKKNDLISEIEDKDKLIRAFQKFKKIKKIEIPKGITSPNPNNKEKIYEATIMTLDGMDHVYRFTSEQKKLNSTANSRENIPKFKLISFQQVS